MAKEQTENVETKTVYANNDRYAVVNDDINGQCVLKSDTVENAIQPFAYCDNDNALVQSTYNIENSNDVVIGPVTHFHCPVTIIQKTEINANANGSNLNLENNENYENNEKIEEEQKHSSDSIKYFRNINFLTRRKLLYTLITLSVILAFVLIGVIIYVAIEKSQISDDNLPITDNPEEVVTIGDIEIFPRWFWGARPPLSVRPLERPVKYIIVAHTASMNCTNFSECAPIMQTLQSIAVDSGSPDIGYNFLIGGDGNIYIGRNWSAINYLQSHSIAVAFIGNFSYDEFTEKMQEALKTLINLGLQENILDQNYVLLSHSQTGSTMSPGVKIRKVIEKWPHYYPNDYIEIPD